MSLPRLFVPATTAVASGGDDARLVHVATVLELQLPQRVAQEVVVGLDPAGRLAVASASTPNLFDTARAQLAFDEVRRTGPHRALAVEELWLFELEVTEQVSADDTLDDPTYLYGTLYGPVTGPSERPLPARLGQLTSTRGELLDALARSEVSAFHFPPPNPPSYSLLLSGDERSTILVVPQVPEELRDGVAANAPVVRHLLSVLLEDFNRDLRARRRSLLSRLLLAPAELSLPQRPTTAQLFAAARAALAHLEGWPSARAHAVAQRVVPRQGTRQRLAQPAATPTFVPRPTPRLEAAAQRAHWLEDFRQAQRGTPPVSTVIRGAPRGWMEDFETDGSEPTAAKPAEVRPEWMKDFE